MSGRLALVVALVAACAPGRVERLEYLDGNGELQRVELPTAATTAEVEGRIGRPNAIQLGPGRTVYWLYTFEHLRFNYVLTFRDDRLAHVRYMPRPGVGP